MKKAVLYGAGNIGRGFIGQLFYQSGYELVFIDVNKELVEKLNKDRSYPVRIMDEEFKDEIIIKNVTAVDGFDIEKVSDEIADADIMATAVGVNVLPRIVKPIAAGLKKRWNDKNLQPLNILICENLLNANQFLAELIKKELNESEIVLFGEKIGLVEASIGRMVPIMTPEMQEGNILRICAEKYCELPVDGDAFKGDIPNLVHMVPFSPFAFYIQRKLFIHNMGHAVSAYLGHLQNYNRIWEANQNPYIKLISLKAMEESAKALSLEHGVPLRDINEYIDDLINRFGNRLLRDSIQRVGKDPLRKLSVNDRFIGAATVCQKHNILPVFISIGIAAGLCFDVKGDEAAVKMQSMIKEAGTDLVLKKICKLKEEMPIWNYILTFYKMFRNADDLASIFSIAEQAVEFEIRRNPIENCT